MRQPAQHRLLRSAIIALCIASGTAWAAGGHVLVEAGTTTRYLANVADPGVGTEWVALDFDDRSWSEGRFGIGHDESRGARAQIETAVPDETRSVYTRTTFVVGSLDRVHNLFLGANYDDGFVVWINGQEVVRSASMPRATNWDSEPASHESRNGADPTRVPMLDISAVGIPALREGENVLAAGVWNHDKRSTDLLLIPRLILNQPLGTLVARGPYLQTGTDTAVTVRWRTDRPTDSRVAFGLRPGSLDGSRMDARVGIDHEVRIDGLAPDTVYYYSVGATSGALEGDDVEHQFRTAPPAGARRPFRSWVIGDSGTAGTNVRTMREGFSRFNGDRPISLWIMLGDNAYKHGTDKEYQAAVFDVFPRQLRRWVLWSTAGNHEGRPSYYDIFSFPTLGEAGGVPSGTEAYYSFDFANAHFVSLNSQHVDLSTDTAMLSWLERDLAATRADWIVAFFHHAPYSTGRHDSDADPKMAAMRTRVLPLLDAGGVDLVLSGHTHAYQRSWLMRGHYGSSDTLIPEMVVDAGNGRPDGTGPYRKPRGKVANGGIVYVVAGSSGEATEDDLRHPALPFSMRRRGSVILEIDGDRLEAQFVEWTGQVQDRFTIVKEGPAADLAARPMDNRRPTR